MSIFGKPNYLWRDFWHNNDDTTYGKKQNCGSPERSPPPGCVQSLEKWALVCNLYVIHMCAWLSVLIKIFSYESENRIISIVANLLSIESRKKMIQLFFFIAFLYRVPHEKSPGSSPYIKKPNSYQMILQHYQKIPFWIEFSSALSLLNGF